MSQHCSHRFKATELAARDGIAAVMARLRAFGLPEGAAGDVELALAEVVNNVIEHAYRGNPGGRIQVTGELSTGLLELRISDSGRPLPGGRIPPFRTADLNRPRAELPEGGFGWPLIRQLSDAVRYERAGTCNTLSMRFNLTRIGQEGTEASQLAP